MQKSKKSSCRYHKKFELVYAPADDLRRLGAFVKDRLNMKNFLIDTEVVFDIDVHQHPRSNTTKWAKLMPQELHEMINRGQLGFPLLQKENYNHLLDFSLGPYK